MTGGRRGRDFFYIDEFVDEHDVVIEYGKWGWRFEWSDMFGPAVINPRTGDPVDKQPSERSPFWRVVSLWAQQGKRIAMKGPMKMAVYEVES